MHPRNQSISKMRRRNWAMRFLAAAALMAGMVGGGADVRATVASFPMSGWVVATNGGQPVTDVQGDIQGSRDLVGDATNPMLYIGSDATHLFFRLRVDSTPLQSPTNFRAFGWGCLINTDADLTTFEYSAFINGVAGPDELRFYQNTVTTKPNDPTDPPEITLSTSVGPLTAAVGHARVVSAPSMFGGDADFFIDWAVDMSDLVGSGFNPANPANYYCGSSNNGATLTADCSGGTICGGLDAEFTDPITCGTLGCYVCGDGTKGAAEGCDDGNQMNGDGCNSVCLLEIGEMCAGMNNTCASGFCDIADNTCACDADLDCPMGQVCNTTVSPNKCVVAGCGNGVVDAGEGCDDSNQANGDGCNSNCLKEIGQTCAANMVCASGFCDPDGNSCACNDNMDCAMGQVCNTQAIPNACVMGGCGNQVVEATEGCDDGNTMAGDGCNATCFIELLQGCTTSPSCASGLCDMTVNQCVCDDNLDCPSGQQCNTMLNPNQCVPTNCGNGMVEGTEGCDDGNLMNNDGCNAQCLKEIGQSCAAGNVCASGFCEAMKCACDQNIDCPGFQVCNVQATPNVCVNPGCGNFVLEAMEGCDDGNMTNGDGCNTACLLEIGELCMTSSVCASASCDLMNNVCDCDSNGDCAMDEVCDLAASPRVCVPKGCGNGVVEMGEGCDDKNMTDGDGCNATCLIENGSMCPGGATTCASGFCDPIGTVCACDENADCSGTQVCNLLPNPNQCVEPGICGNGVSEMGEACDDGNMTNSDGCNAMCLLEIGQSCPGGAMTCASGFCDATDTTCACDQDADCPTGQICNTTANPHVCVSTAVCGNGMVEGAEGCDDGNTTAGDGCSAMCTKELGQTCTNGSECGSGNCDGTAKKCVCDKDADCPMGQTCDTTANPHACVPPKGCTADSECTGGLVCNEPTGKCVECTKSTECASNEESKNICDTATFTCVGCLADTDCPDQGTCTAETQTCKPRVVIVEGGGIICTTSSTSTSNDSLPFGLLGLLGLGALRRRRR